MTGEHAYRLPFVFELEKRGFAVECERPLALVHEAIIVPRAHGIRRVISDR